MINNIPIKPSNATFNDEQWQAIHQKGDNLLVAASAGSGKTTVLIERIFNHLETRYAEIDQLLVVTFTEAAAGEMKERMEARLKRAVNQSSQGEDQRFLIEQLAKLPQANIQTLHAFCLQIIGRFFYLIDFNPNFKLLTDPTQTAMLQQQVWDEMVEAIWQEDEIANQYGVTKALYLDLLARYGGTRSDEPLLEMVLKVYDFARSQPEPEKWLKHAHEIHDNFFELAENPLYQRTLRVQMTQTCKQALSYIEEASRILESGEQATLEAYTPILQADRDQLIRLEEALELNDLNVLIQHVETIGFSKWKTTRKTHDDYDLVQEMKDLRDKAKESVNNHIVSLFDYNYDQTLWVQGEVGKIIEAVAKLTRLYMGLLKQQKEAQGVIDYNDLEHLALDILAPLDAKGDRAPSIAAAYYQGKFKELMIDEFQDTNDIQNKLLYYLSHETREDVSNNLFMVGDVKQSIYGFRMAEPSLFLKRYIAYGKGEGGQLIILDKNYRSRHEVLQFTNYVFERLMDQDFGEMVYGPAEALTTGNHSFIPSAPDATYNIQFLLYTKEADSEREEVIQEDNENELEVADTSLEAQSHLVAQDILQRVNSGELIYDKQLKAQRPIRFSDFVILTPTRKPFLITQRTMESYDIPLFAQKVENYFQRQEVQLMLALLQLIDNPLQDIPMAAILRSYFVGLTDDELSLIRIHQPQGPYYEAVLTYANDETIESSCELQHKLKAFLDQLHHWQTLAGQISLVELIWTIYQETAFIEFVSGLSNGIQREANLHALYQRAIDFEKSQFKGVFGFVRYIERIMKAQQDLAEPVLLDGTQDVVRMMTVHASKGLEFPVVYLMDTAKRFNLADASRNPYIASKQYGIGTDLYEPNQRIKYSSLSKQAFKVEKELALKAEEMRKLYVALTRCEQQLVIVGVVKSQEDWYNQQTEVQRLKRAQDRLIPLGIRKQAQSWLDWLKEALALGEISESVADFDSKQVTLDFIDQNTLLERLKASKPIQVRPSVQTELMPYQNVSQGQMDIDFEKYVNRMLTQPYPYGLATRTSSYQSVSELKRLYEEPRIEKSDYFSDRSDKISLGQSKPQPIQYAGKDTIGEEDLTQPSIQGIRYTADSFQEPKFMTEAELNRQVDYAAIGSATHYVLQYLDFKWFKDRSQAEVDTYLADFIKTLVDQGHIHSELANHIKREKIWSLIASPLGQLMIDHSDRLRREQAFSYRLPAASLFKQLDLATLNELSQDSLLIHGIIDNFIDLEDELILFDYKTDRYKPYGRLSREEQIQQIVKKYRFQLSLYAKALQTAFHKPVNDVYVVLLDFQEAVKLNDLYEL